MKTRLTLVIDVEGVSVEELQKATLTAEDRSDGVDPKQVDAHTLFGCLYMGEVAEGYGHYIIAEQKLEEIEA